MFAAYYRLAPSSRDDSDVRWRGDLYGSRDGFWVRSQFKTCAFDLPYSLARGQHLLWAHDSLVRPVERAKMYLFLRFGCFTYANREHFQYPNVKGENIMKNVKKCKITALNDRDIDSSEEAELILAKAGVEEVMFGDENGWHVSWLVAEVDDELYARRKVGLWQRDTAPEYFSMGLDSRNKIKDLYDLIAEDAANCSRVGFLDPRTRGLQQLLSVFGREFSNFMSRVLRYAHPPEENGVSQGGL